jgi:hypothetical protein
MDIELNFEKLFLQWLLNNMKTNLLIKIIKLFWHTPVKYLT